MAGELLLSHLMPGEVMPLSFALTPHPVLIPQSKKKHSMMLSQEVQRNKGRFFVGGDFDARIHFVREVDCDVCGPHIIGRGMEYLDNMNARTKESRAIFLGFCRMHHLRILNSQFSKPPEKLIT